MKNEILESLKTHARGNIIKHLTNVRVFLERGHITEEQPNVLDYIEREFDKIKRYEGYIELVDKYFSDETRLTQPPYYNQEGRISHT